MDIQGSQDPLCQTLHGKCLSLPPIPTISLISHLRFRAALFKSELSALKSVAACFSPLAPIPTCFTWRRSCTQAQKGVSELPTSKNKVKHSSLKNQKTFLSCISSPYYLHRSPLPTVDDHTPMEDTLLSPAHIPRHLKALPAPDSVHICSLHPVSHTLESQTPSSHREKQRDKGNEKLVLNMEIGINLNL